MLAVTSARWFWLSVCHEIAVRFLSGAAVIARLKWDWRIHFQTPWCGCLGASRTSEQVIYTEDDESDFYNLISFLTCHHFSCIPFLPQTNLVHWGYVKQEAGVIGRGSSFFFFNLFVYFNWRLITLQYCSGFCHTLTWISHGCTCVPHPDPLSHLPPHPIPHGHPSTLALSTCLMHWTWTGDLFHI